MTFVSLCLYLSSSRSVVVLSQVSETCCRYKTTIGVVLMAVSYLDPHTFGLNLGAYSHAALDSGWRQSNIFLFIQLVALPGS